MGSFRTAKGRSADQGILTSADRPADLPETDADGRPNWLGDGESITYWTRMPHGARAKVAGEATDAELDNRGRFVSARYNVGKAAIGRLVVGIIDWTMFDEDANKVPWKPLIGELLVEGLPQPVIDVLGNVIGSKDPKPLNAPANDDDKKGPTEGEDSGNS